MGAVEDVCLLQSSEHTYATATGELGWFDDPQALVAIGLQRESTRDDHCTLTRVIMTNGPPPSVSGPPAPSERVLSATGVGVVKEPGRQNEDETRSGEAASNSYCMNSNIDAKQESTNLEDRQLTSGEWG